MNGSAARINPQPTPTPTPERSSAPDPMHTPIAPVPRALRAVPSLAVLLVGLTIAAAPEHAAAQSAADLTPPRPDAGEAPELDAGGAPANEVELDDEATPPPREHEPRAFQLDLGFGTVFPVSVGPEVTAELPGRLLVQLDAGWLPAGYARAVGGVASALGADALTVDLLERGLSGSPVVRVSLGWRPFKHAGLEVLGGYSHIRLDANVSASAVVEAVTGNALVGNDRTAHVSSSLHALHAMIGWRSVIADHLVLRFSVGYLRAVGSSTAIGLDRPIRGFGPRRVAEAEGIVDHELRRRTQTVTLQAVVAYRL